MRATKTLKIPKFGLVRTAILSVYWRLAKAGFWLFPKSDFDIQDHPPYDNGTVGEGFYFWNSLRIARLQQRFWSQWPVWEDDKQWIAGRNQRRIDEMNRSAVEYKKREDAPPSPPLPKPAPKVEDPDNILPMRPRWGAHLPYVTSGWLHEDFKTIAKPHLIYMMNT